MVNADAFRSFIKGDMKTAEPAPAPGDTDPDAGQEDSLSPGDQAMKAIKAGDSAALEEAIRRCVGDKNY